MWSTKSRFAMYSVILPLGAHFLNTLKLYTMVLGARRGVLAQTDRLRPQPAATYIYKGLLACKASSQ